MDLKLVSIKNFHQKSILKSFDCGINELNEFLSRYALKNDTLGIGKTFIAFDDKDKIVGYFTLSAAQVAFENIDEKYQTKLPKYPIPALRIARLLVSKELQGKGFGKWLLAEVFKKVIAVSEIIGIKFILVDAKESSKTFYEHYGFIKLNDVHLGYFISIETVKMALEE